MSPDTLADEPPVIFTPYLGLESRVSSPGAEGYLPFRCNRPAAGAVGHTYLGNFPSNARPG